MAKQSTSKTHSYTWEYLKIGQNNFLIPLEISQRLINNQRSIYSRQWFDLGKNSNVYTLLTCYNCHPVFSSSTVTLQTNSPIIIMKTSSLAATGKVKTTNHSQGIVIIDQSDSSLQIFTSGLYLLDPPHRSLSENGFLSLRDNSCYWLIRPLSKATIIVGTKEKLIKIC